MHIKKQQLEPDVEQWTGSKSGKEYIKAVYCLFNLYAEYIMRNPGLEEAQAVIKIAGRNINNLRHAGDTCLACSAQLSVCHAAADGLRHDVLMAVITL